MKIAIIGGGGKMGQWFARHLAGEGREVIVTDRDKVKLAEAGRIPGVETAPDSLDAVNRADIIVISVPIDVFEKVIREIAPAVRPEQVVMDITSIKTMPVAVMHRYINNGLVLGTHPLYGPGSPGLKGNNFVLTPVNDREGAFAEKVKDYLESRGVNVKFMTPPEHDKLMAVVQGFTHFVALVSAETLAHLGNLEGMKAVAGTNFRVFLTFIEGIISQDPDLYAAIQMSHPDMPEIYRTLLESQEKWSELVAEKDRAGFMERMGYLKGYFEKNDRGFGKANQDKYRII